MTLHIRNRKPCQHAGCEGLLEAMDDHCPMCGRMPPMDGKPGRWRNVQGQLALRAGRRHRRAQ